MINEIKLMHAKFIAIIIAFQLLAAISIAAEYSLLHNTLFNNGKWIPTKSTLKEYKVMGAMQYYLQRQALAQCKLHLDSWHGYQEVIYKDRIYPRRIAFDFLLSDSAYLYFIFNKNVEKFSCVRLNLNKDLDNSYILASTGGEFLKSAKIGHLDIKKNIWNHFEVVFDKEATSIYLNDKFIGKYEEKIPDKYFFGFRGGKEKVLIDNVIAEDFNFNTIVKEDFCYKNSLLPVLFIAWALFMLLNYALFLLFTAGGMIRKNIFKDLIFINLLIFGFSLFVCFFDYTFLMAKYPVKHRLLSRAENNYNKPKDVLWSQLLQVMEKNKPGVLNAGYSQPKKEIYRILFVGGSQIKGAGAFREDEIISKVVERKLNEQSFKNINFECVNVAIDGVKFPYLLTYYDRWISLSPKMIVVVLLSNTETEIPNNLQKLCSMNKERQIKTVFFLGAQSFFEYGGPDAMKNNALLERITDEDDIPAFEYRSYLFDRKADGIIWWDSTHLTPYGQQLAGEYIFNKIKYLIVTK